MQAPYSELKKGTFLIASPDIDHGIFFRSVILLCDHSTVGSFGLIVNKPLEINEEDPIFDLNELKESNITLRAGGPHQPTQMMLLQTSNKDNENCIKICEGVYLNGEIESLPLEPEENSPLSILFLGYGGWSAGALEKEFLGEAWFLHPASSHHLFETPPEKLWQTLLREMGGKYTLHSMRPENLDLN